MTRRNRKKEENVQDINRFMHEVEEAMHIDAMLNIWHNYKLYIIGFIVGAFLVVTAWQWYKVSSEQGLVNQANSLWQANLSQNTEGYTNLMEQGTGGYKALAAFQLAQQYLEKGDRSSAIAIYESVEKDATVKEIKDIATFNKGLVLLVQEPKKAEGLFQKLVADESVFTLSAREMLAILAENTGDKDKALKIYEMIIANPTTPQTMRNRVQLRLNSMTQS